MTSGRVIGQPLVRNHTNMEQVATNRETPTARIFKVFPEVMYLNHQFLDLAVSLEEISIQVR